MLLPGLVLAHQYVSGLVCAEQCSALGRNCPRLPCLRIALRLLIMLVPFGITSAVASCAGNSLSVVALACLMFVWWYFVTDREGRFLGIIGVFCRTLRMARMTHLLSSLKEFVLAAEFIDNYQKDWPNFSAAQSIVAYFCVDPEAWAMFWLGIAA